MLPRTSSSPPAPLVAVASASAAAIALLATPAFAVVCKAARVGPNVAAQPEPWRDAVAALVQSSATEGPPWGCAGGVVDLSVHDGGATLTVRQEDGRIVTRELASPDEVVPLGEALLAKPLVPLAHPAPPPVAPPPAAPSPGDNPPPSTDAAPPKPEPSVVAAGAPRTLLSALIDSRYAGGSRVIWGGVAAAFNVPFGEWGAGAWARYDGLFVALDKRDAPVHEICVGASASRGFTRGRFEVRGSVLPSVAVVDRALPRGGLLSSETRIDGRLGLEARGSFALLPMLRAALALDTELSPAELLSSDHGRDHAGSSFPTYTVGLGLGLELALR